MKQIYLFREIEEEKPSKLELIGLSLLGIASFSLIVYSGTKLGKYICDNILPQACQYLER
jgi:hypothetical protein